METTLNIDIGVLEKISAAAMVHGVTRSTMIIHLIKRVMDNIHDPARLGRMVQYQDRRNRGYWHTFHLRVRDDEYEYLLDLRKLLKMSVSLILAYAVKKYLKIPIKKLITDNYQFRNYVVMKEVVGDIISWRLIWGFPPDLKNLLPRPV